METIATLVNYIKTKAYLNEGIECQQMSVSLYPVNQKLSTKIRRLSLGEVQKRLKGIYNDFFLGKSLSREGLVWIAITLLFRFQRLTKLSKKS